MSKSSAAKSGTACALEFLAAPEKHPVQGVCAVFGDEAFLKSEVLATLRRQVLAGDDAEFALTIVNGREAQLRDVLDALATVSLFGDGRQLVIVEEADPFVTQYSQELEEFVIRPSKGGLLVLDVKTWASNTRLAKAALVSGLAIECKSLDGLKEGEKKRKEREIKNWLIQRAKTQHQVRLESAAADALLDLVPPEVGILVQEVDKLALLAGEKQTIDMKLVREHVGGWRVRATWDMIDAAAEGRAADALGQLDRIIASGEKPQGLLPQMASTLRRFATAASLIEAAEVDRRRLPLREALAQAEVLPFKLNDAERQLRQIGRPRARQITHWLLAADLAMKGHNSADDAARIELERIIVRLSAT